MTIQACTDRLTCLIDALCQPYQEAIRQLQYTFFDERVSSKEVEAPSLVGRITHLAVGVLLLGLFPGINAVLLLVMRYFESDSGFQLSRAVKEGNVNQLDFFLRIGWSPNQFFRGESLLSIAYRHSQDLALKRLLKESHCNPNRYSLGGNLFHLAAQKQDVETCRLLLSIQADPNARGLSGHYTPACIAYFEGNLELAIEIAKGGNCIDGEVDKRGKTLLNYAWERDDKSMILKLIEAGARPPKKHPLLHFDLFECVYKENKDLIVQMIESYWDINQGNNEGKCLLYLVVLKRDWSFARKLVECGAYISSLTPDKKPLLTFEKYQNDFEYCRDFLGDELLFRAKKNHPFYLFNWLKGDTYLKWTMPSLISRSQKEGANPLERIYFINSEVALQHLSRYLTYSEFVSCLHQFKLKYKSIHTKQIISHLYEISSKHWNAFEEQIDESEEILPPKRHFFLTVIPKAFKQIPTLTRKERTFDGETYSKEELLNLINHLVTAVLYQKKIAGLPVDRDKRRELYRKLENFLRQIAYYLHETEIPFETKKRALLDLAYAGNCARDWQRVLYQVYCLLSRQDYQVLTFSERVMMELGHLRLKLLKNLYKGNPEEFEFALSQIGELRKIPKRGSNIDLNFNLDHSQLEIRHRFDRVYTPTTMSESILKKWDEDPYIREQMRDYFRDVIAKKWIEPPFDLIEKKIKTHEGLSPKEVEVFFRFYGIENVPLKLNGRSTTLTAALDYERFMSLYSQVLLDEQSRDVLRLGVAIMLESMGHLRLKDSSSFSKSFKKSLFESFFIPYL